MSVEPAAQFNHDAKTKVVPSPSKPRRAGRGSLRGKLVLTDDLDSPELNEAIARDFDMPPAN